MLELGLGLLAIIFVSRSQAVDRCLTGLIGRFLHSYTDISDRDLGGLLPVVRPRDILVVYGRSGQLKELDRRPSGPDRDRRHRQAVADQERAERLQAADEAAAQ